MSIFKLSRLVLNEANPGRKAPLQRIPEPEMLMDSGGQVMAFHKQGERAGCLIPVYHWNALRISSLLPYNGHLLDIGSGTGQFLSYLASCRPDIRITGVDLSSTMIDIARSSLTAKELGHRVRIVKGDMLDLSKFANLDIDCVSSIHSIHHLPCESDVGTCLKSVSFLTKATDAGLWIFDFNRPKSVRSAEIFPEIFSPNAEPEFKQDAKNSLIAAYSFELISQLIDETFDTNVKHMNSKWIHLFQAHYYRKKSTQADPWGNHLTLWKPPRLCAKHRLEAFMLKSIFPGSL